MNKILKFCVQLTILCFFIFVVYFAARNIEKQGEQKAKIEQIVESQYPSPTKYPEYTALSNMQILRLIPVNQPKVSNFGAKNKEDGIKGKYHINGLVKKAYLYIDILVDYDRPLTKYDDFFFMVTRSEKSKKGGHIKNDTVLSLPDNLKSVFLYDLSNITYIDTRFKGEEKDHTYKNQNLLSLFENGKNISITAFISSNRPGRIMKEVSIYYQCEENSDCLIEAV